MSLEYAGGWQQIIFVTVEPFIGHALYIFLLCTTMAQIC